MAESILCLTGKSIYDNQNIFDNESKYCELIELRVDCLINESVSKIIDFINSLDKPLILTYRRVIDGGRGSLNESERNELLLLLLKAKPAFIDLEDDFNDMTVEKKADELGVKIIRSFHNFNGIGQDTVSRMAKMRREHDYLLKAAVTIENDEDILLFLDLCESAKKCFQDIPYTLIAMGAMGKFSRILTTVTGSSTTYCGSDGDSAAPGQVSIKELKELYRFDSLQESDPLYGIIGMPLGHTKSPLLHNGWLKDKNLPGRYIAFPVNNPKTIIDIATKINLKGLSVTIPHKESIIPLLDNVRDDVKAIGACNTIYLENNKWNGLNSDTFGFINPLIKFIDSENLNGKKVTVIGAGGAARAAIYALKEKGAEILLLNRTLEKADKLANIFNIEYAKLDRTANSKILKYNDIIVQTTSVGMSPNIASDPLEFYDFKGTEIVYDIIYNPEETAIMKRAAKSGCRTLNGNEMIYQQATVQFKFFTSSSV